MPKHPPAVEAYLKALSTADDRAAIEALIGWIRAAVPDAREVVKGKLILYELGGEPGSSQAMLFGLGAQKNYLAFYNCAYAVVERYRPKLGKLDCGKGCIRFKRLADLPAEAIQGLIAEAVADRRANPGEAKKATKKKAARAR